jgi:hypothetical protein
MTLCWLALLVAFVFVAFFCGSTICVLFWSQPCVTKIMAQFASGGEFSKWTMLRPSFQSALDETPECIRLLNLTFLNNRFGGADDGSNIWRSFGAMKRNATDGSATFYLMVTTSPPGQPQIVATELLKQLRNDTEFNSQANWERLDGDNGAAATYRGVTMWSHGNLPQAGPQSLLDPNQRPVVASSIGVFHFFQRISSMKFREVLEFWNANGMQRAVGREVVDTLARNATIVTRMAEDSAAGRNDEATAVPGLRMATSSGLGGEF